MIRDVEDILKEYNSSKSKVAFYSLYDYFVGYDGAKSSLSEMIMISALATIFTATCCLAPTWRFLARIAFMFDLLLSWLCGFIVKTWSSSYYLPSVQTDAIAVVLRCVIPLLIFNATLNIDYHTLGRVLGPVVLISSILFATNVAIMSVVMYSISTQGYSYTINLVYALILSVVSTTYSVQLVENAQSQVRQLQILLQGEMLFSMAFYSYLTHIVIRVSNFNQMTKTSITSGIFIQSLWSLLGIIPGVGASYLFRHYVNYAYHDCVGQSVMCTMFNVVLYCVCEIIGSDGTLSVLAYGISLGTSKVKFSNKTARFFTNSSNLQHYLSSLIIFGCSGFLVGTNPNKFTFYDAAFVFVVFSAGLASRIAAFTMSYRIIEKLSLQITWRHLQVSVLGAAKSSPFLGYTLLYMSHGFYGSRTMLTYNVLLTCLSFVTNLALLKPSLRGLGMFDLSRAKIVNMNMAVSQVNECRSRAVQGLKVDRVIADANWIVVERSTKLAHPYKKNLRSSMSAEEEDFETKGQSRVVYCNECGAKVAAPLSKKEMEDVSIDIKHRILKAQKVSFHRQHENGTLSSHGVKILSNLVEKVLVRDEPILTAKDLKIQREGTSGMQRLKTIFRHLFTVTSKKHVFIPTFWLRSFCFRICTSRRYQIIMASLSMVDLTFLLIFLHKYYSADSYGLEVTFLQILDFVFYSIFFLEFITEILGIGVIQYFYSPVNLIEFACSCLLRSLEIGLFLDSCGIENRFVDVFKTDPVIMYIKTLLVLRVTRIYVFIVALIPKMLNLIDKKMDDDLTKAYDIGKAYLITQDQVMKFLGHLVTNDEVYNKIQSTLEADRQKVALELGLIKFDRCTIATTNKTTHAIRHVVNTMNDCVSNLKEDEFIDIFETVSLLGSLNRVKNIARSLQFVEPMEPHLVISEIPWLKNDANTINFLLSHTRISSYSKDEVIIEQGTEPIGLFVIIQGLVKATYVPTPSAVALNSQFGLIPNYDFFNNLKFGAPQEEYIVGNTVIGELGVATRRNYNMTAVSQTSVHLVWFSPKIINALVHESGNSVVTAASLWKSIAIKISVNLLQDSSQFRGWPREKLYMYLQGGVVPMLNGIHSVVIGEFVSDVILIEGLAMDQATRLTYVGPYYIPRTVATLLLPGSPMMDRKTNYETKLFVIPNEHYDSEDVSGHEGLFKEHINGLLRDLDGSSRSVKDTECKAGHTKSTVSSYTRRILKTRKKTWKTMKFMEYIPTITGPIEGILATTTFLVQSDKKKTVKTSVVPKMKYYDPTFTYVGDVAENSEIIEPKNTDDDDDYRSESRHLRRSTFNKRSQQSNLSDFPSSRYEVDGSQTKAPGEIKVLESSDDDSDELESIGTLTNVHMREQRLPIARSSFAIGRDRSKSLSKSFSIKSHDSDEAEKN